MSQTENLVSAARLLADLRPSCIAWADMSGSSIFGVDGDVKQVEAIRACTSVPSSTTSSACLAAFAALGISRPVVASPYLSEINAHPQSFFQAHGVAIARMRALELDNEWDIHATPRCKNCPAPPAVECAAGRRDGDSPGRCPEALPPPISGSTSSRPATLIQAA